MKNVKRLKIDVVTYFLVFSMFLGLIFWTRVILIVNPSETAIACEIKSNGKKHNFCDLNQEPRFLELEFESYG